MKNKRNSTNVWPYKIVDGLKIRPVLFNGKSLGKGKFFAAQDEKGDLILRDGNPIPYKGI